MITTASKITLTRILLIPVFVLFACYYGKSVREGHTQEWQRFTAIGVFLLAALSDGIDGYVARHFNQISRLGRILDPIADKGLLLAALITLSFASWRFGLPIWFMVLVIARDAVVVSGSVILHHMNGELHIAPTRIGKTSTALQMLAIGWTMLQLPYHLIPVFAAGFFTLISGAGYVLDGMRQIKQPASP